MLHIYIDSSCSSVKPSLFGANRPTIKEKVILLGNNLSSLKGKHKQEIIEAAGLYNHMTEIL